jgi:hypothetical protein
MERITERPKKVRAFFSPIDVHSEVELLEDGDDHECARAGMTGVVIARHVGVVDGKFFIRLHCGHGCVCAVTREKIKLADQEPEYWN